MTIGIENDNNGYINRDRIVLWPSAGQGFVGLNTKNPICEFDVSGTINTNADIFINGVQIGKSKGTDNESSIAVGGGSLSNNTTGNRNVAIGVSALPYNTTGNNNVAIGVSALQNITTESYNTAIGRFAGSDSNTAGENNTFLGANTWLGGNYSNSTAVGYGAEVTGNNMVQLGAVGCTAQATTFNSTSDYREKDNVMELNETFTVDVLRPVVYDFKPLGKKHIGFIAHEVHEFYPFLVSGEKDGPHSQSLNYNGLIGILTKEIQVLKKKVAEQEEQSAKASAEASAKALAEASAKALAEASAKALEQDTRIQALEQSAKALEQLVSDLINK
jgi:hypothetical protein